MCDCHRSVPKPAPGHIPQTPRRSATVRVSLTAEALITLHMMVKPWHDCGIRPIHHHHCIFNSCQRTPHKRYSPIFYIKPHAQSRPQVLRPLNPQSSTRSVNIHLHQNRAATQPTRRPQMNPARMVYENAPAFIPMPADLQHRRVEAIFWPLDMAVQPLPESSAQTPPNVQDAPPPATPLSPLIGKGKGCFDSAAEIDAFVRAERDAWER